MEAEAPSAESKPVPATDACDEGIACPAGELRQTSSRSLADEGGLEVSDGRGTLSTASQAPPVAAEAVTDPGRREPAQAPAVLVADAASTGAPPPAEVPSPPSASEGLAVTTSEAQPALVGSAGAGTAVTGSNAEAGAPAATAAPGIAVAADASSASSVVQAAPATVDGQAAPASSSVAATVAPALETAVAPASAPAQAVERVDAIPPAAAVDIPTPAIGIARQASTQVDAAVSPLGSEGGNGDSANCVGVPSTTSGTLVADSSQGGSSQPVRVSQCSQTDLGKKLTSELGEEVAKASDPVVGKVLDATPKDKARSRRSRLREYEMRDDQGTDSESQSDDEDAKKRWNSEDNVHNTEEVAVERSPLGRFVRFNRKLGAGSYKTVYLGFDCDTGKEVAWNCISLQDVDKRAKKRITEEINMLKSLAHPRIIAFINAWINKKDNQVCFITERVTGGSLLSYIRRIGAPLKLKVMRTWCRQILEGLDYLHTRSDPIIHRDLKCDNIFINGNVGEVLIGDLGLSTTLKQSCATSIVGTPDFIAPEIYEEKYGTAVDIYAFGMCLLEMVARGSPYEECTTPGQVYRKVIAGEKPRVLRRIKDQQLRLIVDQCIGKDSTQRPTASELLDHNWLRENEVDGNQLCELLSLEEMPPENPNPLAAQPLRLPVQEQPVMEKIAEEPEASDASLGGSGQAVGTRPAEASAPISAAQAVPQLPVAAAVPQLPASDVTGAAPAASERADAATAVAATPDAVAVAVAPPQLPAPGTASGAVSPGTDGAASSMGRAASVSQQAVGGPTEAPPPAGTSGSPTSREQRSGSDEGLSGSELRRICSSSYPPLPSSPGHDLPQAQAAMSAQGAGTDDQAANQPTWAEVVAGPQSQDALDVPEEVGRLTVHCRAPTMMEPEPDPDDEPGQAILHRPGVKTGSAPSPPDTPASVGRAAGSAAGFPEDVSTTVISAAPAAAAASAASASSAAPAAPTESVPPASLSRASRMPPAVLSSASLVENSPSQGYATPRLVSPTAQPQLLHLAAALDLEDSVSQGCVSASSTGSVCLGETASALHRMSGSPKLSIATFQDNDPSAMDGQDSRMEFQLSGLQRRRAGEVSEEVFRDALESINYAMVTQVVMVIQHANCKYNVAFDFDAKTDTAIMVAKELQDTRIAPAGIPMEDLIRDIESAIIHRCHNIAGKMFDEASTTGACDFRESPPLGSLQDRGPNAGTNAGFASDVPSIGTVAGAESIAGNDGTDSLRVGSIGLLRTCSEGISNEMVEGEGTTVCWASLGWTEGKHPQLGAELFRENPATGEEPGVREQVSLLQRSLAYLIPEVQGDDFQQAGDWCEATSKALSSFKEYHKLSNDGVVDDKFWEMISDQVKKKDENEVQKKAKREADRRKLQQARDQRKQIQDQESALQFESMMGMCKLNLSEGKTAAPTVTGKAANTGAGPDSSVFAVLVLLIVRPLR
ncbi:unnamed protein product [Polarella glacialis]|uniref:Protein kinase domain-containing protein n=1 Tax=Polarella glacialis TaxID=89957 RepID=A0A813JB74_POLGL|nr:unnamed protein product [Polarella glacialis]